MLKLSDTVSIPQDVMARAVGEELVILNLKTGSYFGLNPLGARIWHHLSQPKSIGGVCAALCQEYDAPREQIEGDVRALVEDLLEQELVIAAPDDAVSSREPVDRG